MHSWWGLFLARRRWSFQHCSRFCHYGILTGNKYVRLLSLNGIDQTHFVLYLYQEMKIFFVGCGVMYRAYSKHFGGTCWATFRPKDLKLHLKKKYCQQVQIQIRDFSLFFFTECKLPDDGLVKPKHVGAFIVYFNVNFNILTLRRLMSYIYGAPILDVSRSHTTTHHSR